MAVAESVALMIKYRPPNFLLISKVTIANEVLQAESKIIKHDIDSHELFGLYMNRPFK